MNDDNVAVKFLRLYFLKLTVLLAVHLLGVIIFIKPIYAQNQSLSVYPPIIEIQATLPSSPIVPITLTNNSAEVVQLRITLTPFRQLLGTGEVTLDPKLLEQSAYKHYHDNVQFLVDNIKSSSIVLEPQENKQVLLNFNLKEGDPTGDFYYSVIFLSEAADSKETSMSQIPIGISTNVLLTVGSKAGVSGGINEFNTSFLKFTGPVDFNLKVHNAASNYIKPKGRIEIRNIFGNIMGVVEVLPQNILAGSDRYLINQLLASGEAKLSNQNDKNPKAIWPEEFLLGPYQAKAIIWLDDKNEPIEAVTYFIGFPLYSFIPLIIIIFIVLGLYLRIKSKV